jgi:CheY-like chemotaxis protein
MAKILIAEDNLNDLEILVKFSEFLEKHEITIAVNGEEALKKTEEIKPDLILMDLHLPFIDGYKAIKIIKEKMDIPIIVISACFYSDEKEKAYDAGCDDYLVKPFKLDEFLTIVKKYLP